MKQSNSVVCALAHLVFPSERIPPWRLWPSGSGALCMGGFLFVCTEAQRGD